MRSNRLLLAVVLSWSAPSPVAGAGPQPPVTTILTAADLARSGSESGMTWDLELESADQGAKTSSRFRVETHAQNALVEALSPARSKGELMLFNGRLLWFFKPGLNRPVALSSRQRLSGQAANGDIARTNYVGDYDGKIEGEEKVGQVATYVLLLTAKSPDTTYDKIRYWVSKDKLQGVKAQYLALDGTPLKNATFTYGNTVRVAGKPLDFIKELRLEDAANAGHYSVMRFSAVRSEAHPAARFNINNLSR